MQGKETETFRKYLIEEFYDDYRGGEITRRTFIRRVAFITGSMAAAAAAMAAVGCQPIELPATTEPMPVDTPAETTSPPPEAQSPYSVPEDDSDVVTSEVSFDNQGDTITGYLAQPAADGFYPAVLVVHENRGLNPHIEDVARRFAKAGYVALAIDLLAREGGTPAHDRDAVPGLLSDAGAGRHVSDFLAGADYLRTLDSVDGERLGITGYCFGGAIAWRVATEMPDLKAAVPFYGTASELDQAPNINAAVFGVYGELDERVNAGKDAWEQALKDAGVTYQMKVYPGVGHGFHNDTGDRYGGEQAEQAWLDTLAWFEEHL